MNLTRFANTSLALLALAGAGSLHAQEAPAPAVSATTAKVPSTKTAYFDENNKRLPSPDGATRRTETSYRDSVSGVVREYYLPSGKLQFYTPYANVRRRILQGTSSQYYESGQLKRQVTYVAGKAVGDLVTFYPDGTLKRRDHHPLGQPVTGECFGPDGQPVAYFPYEVMPVYSEGAGDTKAIVQAVGLNTRYPKEALRRRVTGVVKIAFVVDKNGLVQNVRPNENAKEAPIPPDLLDAYHELQEAAMQAVRQLKSFAPGRQDGEAVAVSFSVPVTFKIK